MQMRQLGNSDMRISRLGVGAWAMGGGGWRYGWGPQSDKDSIAAIHQALEAGINWIDTAPVYGLGHSEEVVARALDGYSSRPLIFTKCSRVWNDQGELSGCLKASSIRREVEASLRRLKVEVIDLYQMHWPDPDEDIEEGWTTMAQLQAEGKVRYLGVSNFSVRQMQRAQAIAPITSLQPHYSLLARGIEESILPFAQQNHIGVIVYSPMRSGLLSGSMTRERIAAFPPDDFRRNVSDFQEPLLTRNLQLVELLRAIGKPNSCTPGEVAIAWTLRHPAVTAAIVGLRSPGQVEGVIHADGIRLGQQDLNEIEGLLKGGEGA
jgi:aryl-alcohol dehydrogenase-like predicted oxidoreductase